MTEFHGFTLESLGLSQPVVEDNDKVRRVRDYSQDVHLRRLVQFNLSCLAHRTEMQQNLSVANYEAMLASNGASIDNSHLQQVDAADAAVIDDDNKEIDSNTRQ